MWGSLEKFLGVSRHLMTPGSSYTFSRHIRVRTAEFKLAQLSPTPTVMIPGSDWKLTFRVRSQSHNTIRPHHRGRPPPTCLFSIVGMQPGRDSASTTSSTRVCPIRDYPDSSWRRSSLELSSSGWNGTHRHHSRHGSLAHSSQVSCHEGSLNVTTVP
jgi:hypothetical protein